MTRGRKPKPHNLQVIDGNPGKRKILAAPLRVEVLFAPPPPELDDDTDARDMWLYLMPHMVKYELYNPLYRPFLSSFCITWSKALRSERRLKSFGSDTYETSSENGVMHRSRPEISIINDCLRVLRSIGSDLGLSPVSHKHLGNAAQGELFGDPMRGFDR